jgi:hypothetical protein
MTRSRAKIIPLLFAVTLWCLIALSLAWSNLSPSDGPGMPGAKLWVNGLRDWIQRYGWPVEYLVRCPVVAVSPRGQWDISVRARWTVSGLLINSAVILSILISTALVLMKWFQSPSRMQLRLKTVMVMMAVVAVLTTLYKARYDLNFMMLSWHFEGNPWEIPLYLKMPISVGIGCVVFAAITSGLSTISRLMQICLDRQRRDRGFQDRVSTVGKDGV